MPWGEEQERLTQEARLSVASPEEVVLELKRIAQQPRLELRGREPIEALLVERSHPLINLGLACYGTSEEVFKALYKHGLEKPADVADERYKRGLRIGCLSNRSVPAAHRVSDFPRRMIGPEEIERVLAAGDDAEAEALICNPLVSERLLEELYERTGAFATLDEERWLDLIYRSRKNERLITNEDDDFMPDMGHYGIHRAIFRLLEIAPVDIHWLRVLYGLLDHLDFRQVAHPETIKTVLSRWAQLDDKIDGKPMEGYFTSLSIKDEFRCLIAALYGRTWSNNKSAVQGSLWAADVAMRCAYYGNAELSAIKMRAGYKRDRNVYVFAAMYNDNIFSNHKLRKLFEKKQLAWAGSGLSRRYLKNFELKRKQWPFLESFLPDDIRTEAATTKNDGVDEKAIVRAVESGLDAAVNKITAKIFRFINIGMFVFVGAYLVYNYGLNVLGFLAAAVYMIGHGVGIW
jgi:hypothetical protein